ncbi:carbohydrate ABC transporter permease [Paenibacillus radicis (ex Xue et al. 2023)]|uniref:Sugar ABC transporter permease n=1 Tax=Paenibacillus radicis (ex Xue et al. 2023) TaxID=2972489 RepID=A0ABT1YGG1_9BACL|nr:sugar ABC transporter permease [Paenibacillus radicis (ex Xue et al. 2023)]MCR8632287.1 sugar ABC transporter permease [Paenibacillus radicis (ex Xue et al. 2023)]
MSRSKTRKIWIYIAFVSPAVLFFALFIMLPFFRAIIFSFQDWNGISRDIKWAGLSNYKRLLHDIDHIKSFVFTIKYVVVSTILVNLAGFALAFVLNMALKTKNALRTVFFLPHVIGSLIIGFIWQFIITRGFPQIASVTGISIFEKNWLSLPDYAFWALVLVNVWHYAGYLMIIYLAALQGIPSDLLEAAQIDGANRWHRLRSIIIPLIMPAITVCLFLAISHGFKVFDLNFVLTHGGPFGSTESLALHIYLDAFTKNEYTYASAKSVVFFLILASVTVIQVFLLKRKEVEM